MNKGERSVAAEPRDSEVLPRGRLAVLLIPLSVQSRDHLATITYIYVPSFSSLGSRGFCPVFFPVHFSRIFARAFLGSYAGYYPAFISSVPRYIMPAFRLTG